VGKNSQHYVNNVEFCKQLIIHRNNVFTWKDTTTDLVNIFNNQLTNTQTLLDLYSLRCTYEYLIANILNKPRVSNYLATQLEKIATKFAQSPLYINRTYKADMIDNAIENCLKYITNFNPEVTTNAFAYFTTCCYYAFLRTIYQEHKQRDIETKIISESEFSVFFNGDSLEDHERQQLKEVLELKTRTERSQEYLQLKLKPKTNE
jgi:hypothetical protein